MKVRNLTDTTESIYVIVFVKSSLLQLATSDQRVTQLSFFRNLRKRSPQTKAFIVLRGLAGALLLLAACLKAYQLVTGPALGDYWWNARLWQSLAVGVEVFFAGWMWSGLAPRLTRLLGLAIFGTFSMMTLIKALEGESSCGCFGAVTVSPWVTLGIDVAFCLGFALIRPVSRPSNGNEVAESKSRNEPGAAVLPWGLVVLAGVAGGVLGAWTMTAEPAQLQVETGELLGDSDFVLLEPEEWIGHSFPLFSYSDLPTGVSQGNWWVMLYSPTCGHCIETIPKIIVVAQAGQQVALLSMPPHDTNKLNFPNGVVGRLNDARDWFAQTPVLIELEDGIVVRSASGTQVDDWF